MFMKTFKSLIIAFILILCLSVSAFAEDAIAVTEMKNPSGTLLCVAHGGAHGDAEPNSEEAIDKAIELGADIVSIDVKKAVGGMTAIDNSEETDLEFFLLDYNTRVVLIINNAERYKKELYKILESTESFESVILRMECEFSEIADWYNSLKVKPMIICRYSGNIIFNALSEASDNFDAKLPVIEYASKNVNGVIFNGLTLNNYVYKNYLSKGRKFISMTDKTLCGGRQDTIQYWDELCSYGFNMIETDNAEGFIKYRNNAKELYAQLKSDYALAKKADTEKASATSLKNYNAVMAEVNELLSKGIYSSDALDLARCDLNDVVEELSPSYGNSKEGKLDFSMGKISLVVCAVIIFAIAQIHILKKRKKAG